MTADRYELIYWPFLQGRGEFVRLALEAAQADYVDVARGPESEGGGVPAVLSLMKGGHQGPPVFAPPILRNGELLIAQTAAILHYLGPRLGLAPDDETARVLALQYQLTIADWVDETHDTHHPIAMGKYYEDQKAESIERATYFRKQRIPKFMSFFERAVSVQDGTYLFGETPSYADLSLFQMLEGLAYAFPKAFASAVDRVPRLSKLRLAVRKLPHVEAYLASDRRIPFNEEGIFRHYPELDGEAR